MLRKRFARKGVQMTQYQYKYDKYDFSAGIRQYKAIMDGQDAEFIPVTTQMAEFCMAYGKHNGRRFFSDPELFVRGCLDVQQEFGFDIPDMVWDVYSVEAEALGGDMAWFDDLYPALDNTRVLIANEKDLARIKAPDPLKTGRMPWVLEALRICQELTGFAHHIHYCAPINLCAQVMQFEKMVVAMEERPQFVHKVMDWLVEEVLAPYINTYFKVIPGSSVANGKDAVGSLPFITEKMVHEFSVPYLDKLRALTGNRPGMRCDNWWGDAFAENAEKYWDIKLHITPQYLKVQDADCFRVGTERIRRYADTKGCALSFGVGTLLLQKGSREDITRRVHEYMEVGSRGPVRKEVLPLFLQLQRADSRGECPGGDRGGQELPRRGATLCRAGAERPGRRGHGIGGRQGLHGDGLRRGCGEGQGARDGGHRPRSPHAADLRFGDAVRGRAVRGAGGQGPRGRQFAQHDSRRGTDPADGRGRRPVRHGRVLRSGNAHGREGHEEGRGNPAPDHHRDQGRAQGHNCHGHRLRRPA
ncbi:MAG: hypothetical protein IPH30_17755 [Betaproteobacteria bacterium]|nr:hypothetical protein [Betaproteobacteria bacterium]